MIRLMDGIGDAMMLYWLWGICFHLGPAWERSSWMFYWLSAACLGLGGNNWLGWQYIRLAGFAQFYHSCFLSSVWLLLALGLFILCSFQWEHVPILVQGTSYPHHYIYILWFATFVALFL